MAGTGISPTGIAPHDILGDLGRMRRVGLNAAAVDVFWYVDGISASSVHPGPATLSDADLEAAIASARSVGMRVVLTPKVFCPSCRQASWRGILTPRDQAAFFLSYRSMIRHYAELAQRNNVWLFFIGSEYNTLQGAADQWRLVARDVRSLFAGHIGYEVNWDVWNQVGFWDAVDVVGISAYFPLTDAQHPTVDELKAGWIQSSDARFLGQTWLGDLTSLATSTGKPILFGEIGYPTWTFAAREPFEPNRKHRAPDDQGQAAGFQAALETFENQPWWLGAIWWEWKDTGAFTFRDRPAERFLTRWYVDGWRPAGVARPAAPVSLPPLKPYVPPVPVTTGLAATLRYRAVSVGAILLVGLAWTAWLAVALGRLRLRRRGARPRREQRHVAPASEPPSRAPGDPIPALTLRLPSGLTYRSGAASGEGGTPAGSGRQRRSAWRATSTEYDGFESR